MLPTNFSRHRLLAGVAALTVWLILGGIAQPWSNGTETEMSPVAARALEAKIQALSNSDPAHTAGFQPIVITDREANSYLKYRGRDFLPPGVYNPEVHIHRDQVSAAAEVDFNELNQPGAKNDDWVAKALATLLQGRQHVSAKGKLDSGDGQGKVTVEGVQIGRTEIPDWLVAALLQNYLQSRFKVDLNKPLILPDHVARIELEEGRATFYRSPTKK